MLTERADLVVGVDTHGRRHAFAMLETRTGAVLGEWQLPASARGYRQALAHAQRLRTGRRLWALEGSGSYGAGLARFLLRAGESVREVERPLRRGLQGRMKSDLLGMVLRRKRRQVTHEYFLERLYGKRITERWPLVRIIDG